MSTNKVASALRYRLRDFFVGLPDTRTAGARLCERASAQSARQSKHTEAPYFKVVGTRTGGLAAFMRFIHERATWTLSSRLLLRASSCVCVSVHQHGRT